MLEILSHVNKRVRGHASIKMPLDALLALYAEPSSAPLVRNFALVYLEMVYERATEEARLAVVRLERLADARPVEQLDVTVQCSILPNHEGAYYLLQRSSTAGQSPLLQSAAYERGWHTLSWRGVCGGWCSLKQ